MRISIGEEQQVEYGNYEKGRVSNHITLSHTDLGYSDDEWLELVQRDGPESAYELLYSTALGRHNRRMYERLEPLAAYILDEDKSFLPLWLDDNAP